MTSLSSTGARAPIRGKIDPVRRVRPAPLPAMTSTLLLVAGAALAGAALAGTAFGAAALAGPSPVESGAASRSVPGDTDAKLTDSGSVVKVLLRPEKLSATPGGAVAFEVVFTVADGWHLYAHGDTVFYGIALKGPDRASEGSGKDSDQAAAGAVAKESRAPASRSPLGDLAVDYPAGTTGDFFGTPVSLLQGRQVIRVRSTIAAGAKTGKVDVPLGLEVQACDDQRCLAPATIPLKLRLDVKRAG